MTQIQRYPWKGAALILTGALVGCVAGAAVTGVHADAPAPVSAPAKPMVAVLDIKDVVDRSDDGKRARGEVKRLFDQQQAELEKQQEALTKEKASMDAEIEKRKGKTTPALEKRLDEWDRKNEELKETFTKFDKELERKQDELTGPLVDRVRTIASQIAAKDGYEVVVDKAATAYSVKSIDITMAVLTAMNAK